MFSFALPTGMLLQSETKIEPDLRLLNILILVIRNSSNKLMPCEGMYTHYRIMPKSEILSNIIILNYYSWHFGITTGFVMAV